MKDGGALVRLGQDLRGLRPSLHNGPGWRVGLWLQGCSLRCTSQCLNPRLLPASGGHAHSVPEVIDRLSEIAAAFADPVEGVTVLGGEPTDQPAALVEILRGARGLGLTTMVYTGHRLAELQGVLQSFWPEFARVTDLLVDGPFVAELYDPELAWRGSSNQVIHRLSDRYSRANLDEAFRRQRKGYSIALSADGRVSASGFQNRGAAAAAERSIARSVETPGRSRGSDPCR